MVQKRKEAHSSFHRSPLQRQCDRSRAPCGWKILQLDYANFKHSVFPDISRRNATAYPISPRSHDSRQRLMAQTKNARLGSIQPIYLPPYSPDFNPIERLWLNLKQNFFNLFTAHTHDALTNRLADALCFYIDRPELRKSILQTGKFHLIVGIIATSHIKILYQRN